MYAAEARGCRLPREPECETYKGVRIDLARGEGEGVSASVDHFGALGTQQRHVPPTKVERDVKATRVPLAAAKDDARRKASPRATGATGATGGGRRTRRVL